MKNYFRLRRQSDKENQQILCRCFTNRKSWPLSPQQEGQEGGRRWEGESTIGTQAQLLDLRSIGALN